MILVDTSIWIEFLRCHAPFYQQLQEKLERAEVVALEPIFAELLQGARDKREKEIIRGYWQNIPQIDLTGLWLEAGQLSHEKKFLQKGVGLIDAVLVATAQRDSHLLWTLDKKLLKVLVKEEIFTPSNP